MEFLSGDETYNADEEATNEYKTYCLEQDKFASFDYFPDAADFIEAVLKADKDKFPETLRSHDIRLNATGFTRKLVGIICYTLTDFNSNCNQVFSSNNHERISFVKYIVPMFKYFGQETNLIEFRWYEKDSKSYNVATLTALFQSRDFIELNSGLEKRKRKPIFRMIHLSH